MANILIIDDDKVICDILTKIMESIGHNACYAMTGSDGVNLAESSMFDVVFLDVNLPDVNGLDLIKILKEVPSSPEVIIVTGENNPDGAQIAINSGAWNYIEKPFLRQDLTLQVNRALLFRSEKRRIPVTGSLKRNTIVGESEEIKHCIDQISTAIYSDVPVVISGEPGTGKELFAKTIHLNSERYKNNFVNMDCTALGENVFEKMLFGSAKGSGADESKKSAGLIQKAEGGTLFLDKFDKLPAKTQQSLLSLVGEKNCGFRLTASTCKKFDELDRSAEGLAKWFNSSEAIFMNAPSLRTIKEDSIRIALFYIDYYCKKKYGVTSKGVSPEVIDIIGAFNWPGNTQELMNAVEKAVASAKNEPTLYSIHLPSYIKSGLIKEILKQNAKAEKLDKKTSLKGEFPPLKVFMETSEKQYLTTILSHVSGSVKDACRISGISSSSMYERLKKYGLL